MDYVSYGILLLLMSLINRSEKVGENIPLVSKKIETRDAIPWYHL